MWLRSIRPASISAGPTAQGTRDEGLRLLIILPRFHVQAQGSKGIHNETYLRTRPCELRAGVSDRGLRVEVINMNRSHKRNFGGCAIYTLKPL